MYVCSEEDSVAKVIAKMTVYREDGYSEQNSVVKMVTVNKTV